MTEMRRPRPPQFAALLVTLFATGTIAADNPQPADPITVVTLGDSITKGVRSGVSAEQTFASLVEKELNATGRPVRVINVGIGGERTDQALSRFEQIVQLDPDVVTVMYGTNDSYVDQGELASRISVDEYRQNLTQLVVELLRRGIVPVLMTEPRWSDKAVPNGLGENPNVRLEPYVVACRETAQAWRVPLVDHFASWTLARNNGTDLHAWTTDACHPNADGHRRLAEAMLPLLTQAVGLELKMRSRLLAGEPLRVVCFGDSVTGVYYHTGSRRAYADMLEIALNRVSPGGLVEVINAGISGHTTVNALARIDRDVLMHKPDLVTVMFGLNDMVRVPLEEYRANLEAIVSKCRDDGAEVVLATPNNVIDTDNRPTEGLRSYCDAVRQVARELEVPLCDCYREFDAVRANDYLDWRLLMSDAIHPNMDGHKQIARQLAQTITRQRVSLVDVGPQQPAIVHTLALLEAGKPIRVLAMPPFDALIEPALKRVADARVEVTSWPIAGLSLSEIEADAKARVRAAKPDLVLIAVPRSADSMTDEEFAGAFAWIMNWSLNFGSPTWDCVVVHPSIFEPGVGDRGRDDLIRRLVRAQDLVLIDRSAENKLHAATILEQWLADQTASIEETQ